MTNRAADRESAAPQACIDMLISRKPAENPIIERTMLAIIAAVVWPPNRGIAIRTRLVSVIG